MIRKENIFQSILFKINNVIFFYHQQCTPDELSLSALHNNAIIFQYKEEVDTLNEASRERPRGALIASIERESRLMRDVQRENGELRAALEDHRRALELIMSKYRQHTEKRIWESRIDFTNAINEKQQDVCIYLILVVL